MTDAALYHDELLDLERQLEAITFDANAPLQETGAVIGGAVTGISSGEGGHVNAFAAHAAAVHKSKDVLRRLHRHLQQLQVEVRLLDGEERELYETRAREHASTIASLQARVQQGKTRFAQGTTHAAAGPSSSSSSSFQIHRSARDSGANFRAVQGGAGVRWAPSEGDCDAAERGSGPVIANRAEARQAATRINEIQHSTLHSLVHTEKLLNETESLGNGAATMLQAQTEQIRRTNAELDEIHSELGLASRELKGFMRRMARDRLIIVFSIAIVVCLIITLFLAILRRKWS
ncbi:hypothetical protein JKF63_05425 [Porcisia hertigi]|uniref:t-SNARE coiled-coil homology domain-containing protein n=1 Tax=Porcisia hertigi TaxID=2761500 RepID=A0A836IMS0_9TRYP|nr:hypothetical protein JKF63_05425 [Porcisia hertigi]